MAESSASYLGMPRLFFSPEGGGLAFPLGSSELFGQMSSSPVRGMPRGLGSLRLLTLCGERVLIGCLGMAEGHKSLIPVNDQLFYLSLRNGGLARHYVSLLQAVLEPLHFLIAGAKSLLQRKDGLAIEDVTHHTGTLGVVASSIIQFVSPGRCQVPHHRADVRRNDGCRCPARAEVVVDDWRASSPVGEEPTQRSNL